MTQTITHELEQITFARHLDVSDASIPSSIGSLPWDMEEVKYDTAPCLSNTEANTASQLQPFTFPREFLSWTDVTVAVHTMALRENKQVDNYRNTSTTPRLQEHKTASYTQKLGPFGQKWPFGWTREGLPLSTLDSSQK